MSEVRRILKAAALRMKLAAINNEIKGIAKKAESAEAELSNAHRGLATAQAAYVAGTATSRDVFRAVRSLERAVKRGQSVKDLAVKVTAVHRAVIAEAKSLRAEQVTTQ
jgi:hypothetical protein